MTAPSLQRLFRIYLIFSGRDQTGEGDGKEGVPIFEAPYVDKRTSGWGGAYVKFFWPDEKK